MLGILAYPFGKTTCEEQNFSWHWSVVFTTRTTATAGKQSSERIKLRDPLTKSVTSQARFGVFLNGLRLPTRANPIPISKTRTAGLGNTIEGNLRAWAWLIRLKDHWRYNSQEIVALRSPQSAIHRMVGMSFGGQSSRTSLPSGNSPTLATACAHVESAITHKSATSSSTCSLGQTAEARTPYSPELEHCDCCSQCSASPTGSRIQCPTFAT